jgi:hypothetical protein
MSTFKKYKPTNEFLNMVKDPFREGSPVWEKQIKIDDISIVKVSATISGTDKIHTAVISIITNSMDNFGEELAKERLVIHQKDFSSKAEAIEYLKTKEKETSYK